MKDEAKCGNKKKICGIKFLNQSMLNYIIYEQAFINSVLCKHALSYKSNKF